MEGNTEHYKYVEIGIIESSHVNIMEKRVHQTNHAKTALCICMNYTTWTYMTFSCFLKDLLQFQAENEVQYG